LGSNTWTPCKNAAVVKYLEKACQKNKKLRCCNADRSLEAIKRFNNGEFLPLCENYADKWIGINMDFLIARQAPTYKVRGTVRRRGGFVDCDLIGCEFGRGYAREFSMLVWVGDVAKGFRPIDSVVRLECFDHGDVDRIETQQFLPNSAIESPALGISFGIGDYRR
jgi:hypothetical protein